MIILAQVVHVSVIFTPCRTCVVLLDLHLPPYFDLSFSVFFHSSVLMHPDLHTDLDNLDSVENNLRNSAKGSLHAYVVTFSLTGYEPNDMVLNELGNSQGSFSYITPSSDLDIDDTTLGKLLTEAHRGQADYRSPEGVSVRQSSLSVVFDRTGKLVGERNVDHSIGFGVTRNTYSVHSKFSENTQVEKVVDRTGKLVGENSSKARQNDVLGNHFKDRLFHLVHWLSITLLLRRISLESINLERKSCLDCSSDTLCTREEFGGVTY